MNDPKTGVNLVVLHLEATLTEYRMANGRVSPGSNRLNTYSIKLLSEFLEFYCIYISFRSSVRKRKASFKYTEQRGCNAALIVYLGQF